MTEADRKRLMEAFHGFGEGSGPPPALDLAGDIADRLRIREEAPCVAAPLGPLPRREKSPECAECGHPKDGHRDSLGMRRGCWNCLECKGFVPKEVR